MRVREPSGRGRAVSDVVGFVLIFSIIITGVGLVSVTGFNQLSDFTDRQQVENGERGLASASATLDNIHRNGDTYRQFDLPLAGGDLWLNGTEISISGDIDTSGLPSNGNIEVNALEHRFDYPAEGVSLVYEAGGLFRTRSVTPRYRPTVQCSPSGTTIVSLVSLSGSERIVKSGSYDGDLTISPTSVPNQLPVSANNQFVTIKAELVDQNRVLKTNTNSGDEVRIDVSDAAYPDQWGTYLTETGWTDAGGGEYSCQGDTILVRVSTLQLSVLEQRSV